MKTLNSDLDFIVGYKIHLSGNHTCEGTKGVFRDMCDELQGKYPRDFNFSRWHEGCRCYVTSILKTFEEMSADDNLIMRGMPPTEPISSENYVADVPGGFKRYILDNRETILKQCQDNTAPQWVCDNMKYIKPLLDADRR